MALENYVLGTPQKYIHKKHFSRPFFQDPQRGCSLFLALTTGHDKGFPTNCSTTLLPRINTAGIPANSFLRCLRAYKEVSQFYRNRSKCFSIFLYFIQEVFVLKSACLSLLQLNYAPDCLFHNSRYCTIPQNILKDRFLEKIFNAL